MANAKHTPGPWLVIPQAGETTVWNDDGRVDHFVCSLFKNLGGPGDGDRLEADAALISAAPDLLAALKEVCEWISNWDANFTQDDEWPATSKRINDAIRKAEGRV
jgi:hypothetical protein